MQLELDDQAADSLFTYFVELKKWSKKVNLIAKDTKDDQSLENHFLDSLALLPFLPAGCGLVDIGTGAGFPGLVWLYIVIFGKYFKIGAEHRFQLFLLPDIEFALLPFTICIQSCVETACGMLHFPD